LLCRCRRRNFGNPLHWRGEKWNTKFRPDQPDSVSPRRSATFWADAQARDISLDAVADEGIEASPSPSAFLQKSRAAKSSLEAFVAELGKGLIVRFNGPGALCAWNPANSPDERRSH
jgi:hypothetical protein